MWRMILASIVFLIFQANDNISVQGEEDPARVFGFSGPLVGRRWSGVTWPSPWSCWTAITGDVSIRVVNDPSNSGVPVLHLRSVRGSFVLYQDLRTSPLPADVYPKLTWRWKAIRLPTGASAHDRSRNDQVLQVYLAFRRSDGYDILGYVWDNPAGPGETDLVHASYRVLLFGRIEGYIHILRRGVADDWVTEKRDIVEDHKQYFRSSQPRVVAIGIWCDSNDTGSIAEGMIGPLVFSQ
ncbi:MAG: DUF3047 domain-containing protein [Thermogutta sp.]